MDLSSLFARPSMGVQQTRCTRAVPYVGGGTRLGPATGVGCGDHLGKVAQSTELRRKRLPDAPKLVNVQTPPQRPTVLFEFSYPVRPHLCQCRLCPVQSCVERHDVIQTVHPYNICRGQYWIASATCGASMGALGSPRRSDVSWSSSSRRISMWMSKRSICRPEMRFSRSGAAPCPTNSERSSPELRSPATSALVLSNSSEWWTDHEVIVQIVSLSLTVHSVKQILH